MDTEGSGLVEEELGLEPKPTGETTRTGPEEGRLRSLRLIKGGARAKAESNGVGGENKGNKLRGLSGT